MAISPEKIIELPQKPRILHEAAENIPVSQLEEIAIKWSPRRTERVKRIFRLWLSQIKEFAKDGVSRVYVINGEWGLGKTMLAKNVFPKLIQEEGLLYKYIRFDDLIKEVKCRFSENVDSLEAFEEVFTKYVSETNANYNTPLVLLIDEVEGIIGLQNEPPIQGVQLHLTFISMIRELLSGKDAPFGKYIKGKVHLVLFTTPHALNFIRRILSAQGYSGWLLRRESECDIYPLNKIEFIQCVKALLEYMSGITIEQLLDDFRILELLYMLTSGNIGLTVKILGDIVQAAYKDCKEDYGKECLYKLSIDYFSKYLENYASKFVTRDFRETSNILNFDLTRRILETSKRMKFTEEILKKIIFTSSIIPNAEIEKEIPRIVLSNFLLDNFGLKLKIFRLYRLSSVENFLDKLTNKLAERNSELDKDALNICVMSLICLTKGGEFRIAIPITRYDEREEIDRDELGFILSSYTYVRIPEDIENFLLDNLSGYDFSYGEGLSSLSKATLYPLYSPMLIPFIVNPEAVRSVFSHIRHLYNENTKQFENLVRLSIIEMFEKNEYIEKINNTYYLKNIGNAIFSVSVIVGSTHPEDLHKMYERDTACILIFSPSPIISERPWNIFCIQMPIQDMFLLAARKAAEILGFNQFIDHDKLADFYLSIFSKYNFQRVIEEWKKEALKRGILIRDKIGFEDFPIISGAKRKPHLVFLDYYRALLVGGTKADRESLVDLLVELYKIRPFEGLSGVSPPERTPRTLSLPDIEPENPLRDEKYVKLRERVEHLVDEILNISKLVGLADYDQTTKVFYLTLLPSENRILELLKKRSSISIKESEDYFVFEKSGGSDAGSKQIFREFIVEMLRCRGFIDIDKKGKEEFIIPLRLSDEKVYELLETTKEKLENIRDELTKLRIIDENASICHILIAKQKGLKIIFLGDIENLIYKFIKMLESSKENTFYYITENLVNYLEYIFEKFLIHAIRELNQKIDDINYYIKHIQKRIEETANFKLKPLLPSKLIDIITIDLQKDIENYTKIFETISKNIEAYMNVSKEKLIEEILKSENHIRKNNLFRYPPNEKDKYYYNFISLRVEGYYGQFKNYNEQIEGLLNNIDKCLEKISENTRKYKLQVEILNEVAEEVFTQIYSGRENLGGLRGVSAFLERISRELESKGELLKQINEMNHKINEKRIDLEKLNKNIKEKYDENISMITRIQEIYNALLECGVEEEIFKQMINSINEFKKELNEKIQLSNIRIPEFSENILSNNLDDLKKILDTLTNYESQLKNYLNLLSNQNERLSNMLNTLKKIIEVYINNLQKRISDWHILLKELKAQPEHVDLFIKKKNDFEKLTLGFNIQNKDTSEIVFVLKELHSIESEMKLILQRVLGEPYFSIYLKVIDYIKSQNEPVRLYDLVNFIANETNMDVREILNIIFELDKIGILEIKIRKY
jgi:hypothetical protein